LKPVREDHPNIHHEKSNQKHESVACGERSLVDLVLGENPELKTVFRGSHALDSKTPRPRECARIGILTLREKGQCGNVSTALDLR
jgi:hypothetical protein